MPKSTNTVDLDFTARVAETKAEIKRIKQSQAETKKVLVHLRNGRDQQKAIDYPRFEKMFAKSVRDLEKLVSSQDEVEAAGGAVIAAYKAADKALKKYVAALAKAEKCAVKARVSTAKIVSEAEN